MTSYLPDQPTEGYGRLQTPAAVQFPLTFILTNGPAPVQYRAITDVSALPSPRQTILAIPLAYPPALRLALAQDSDGKWGDSMLAVPQENGGQPGTITAFRRLLEFGWEPDSPPLVRARRVLFRLLAEDDDRDQLAEFKGEAGEDIDLIHRSRQLLREAAAAALAHAGYEGDPRLRGAARRILARVDAYLASPLAARPWVRVGNRQVLAAEAAPPSLHVLTMLAHMPLFRSEHHSLVNRLFTHLSQPSPRQEVFQLVGRHVVAQPHLVLGDPLSTRNLADSEVPFAVMWLELMARLGFLRRHEGWTSLFERFLDDRDRDFVWHPHRGAARPYSTNPDVWVHDLREDGAAGDRAWIDVNFRLGLIAKLLGRPIEPV